MGVTAKNRVDGWKGLLDLASEIFFVLDLNGRICELSGDWSGLCREESEAWVGRRLVSRLHEEDQLRFSHFLRKAGHASDLRETRFRLNIPNQGFRWMIARARQTEQNQIVLAARDLTNDLKRQKDLQCRDRLLKEITDLQTNLLSGELTTDYFNLALTAFIRLTESEYGFIGEVLKDDQGKSYLKTFAISNIAWNAETREMYRSNGPAGFEFRNLDNLFGEVIKSNGPVVANNPAQDPRSGGLPEGHPPLRSFLGLPFMGIDGILGVLGVANRPMGYSEELMGFLKPLVTTVGSVIHGQRNQRRTAEMETRINHLGRLQNEILQRADTTIIATDPDGLVTLFNQAAEYRLGYRQNEVVGKMSILNFHQSHELEAQANQPMYRSGGAGKNLFSVLVGKAQTGATERREWTYVAKNGQTFSALLAFSRLEDEQGNISGYLAVGTDLTERKAHEATTLANSTLTMRLDQMKKREQESHILREGTEYLHCCETLIEGFSVVRRFFSELLSDAWLEMYKVHSKDAYLERLSHEEDREEGKDQVLIPADQCWAMRAKRAHLSEVGGPGMICRHLSEESGKTAYCIPLMHGQDIFAVMTVYIDMNGHSSESESESSSRNFLSELSTMAHHFSVSLANVKLREKLQTQATRDYLTGLRNRREFRNRLNEFQSIWMRNRRNFSLLMLDIDCFKKINDGHGHDRGDEVIRTFSKVLKENIRDVDCLARLGGDEFALLLHETGKTGAVPKAERLRVLIEKTYFGIREPVTVSIGIAEFGSDAMQVSELVNAADRALYFAKRNGKNQVADAGQGLAQDLPLGECEKSGTNP